MHTLDEILIVVSVLIFTVPASPTVHKLCTNLSICQKNVHNVMHAYHKF